MSGAEPDSWPTKAGALCLLSGGLDSQLAICVLRDQGIAVQAVTFESPFFGAERGRRAAAKLGVELHVLDFTSEVVGLLSNPPHGFGSRMNPCIDCHINMLRRAGVLMRELGLSFLATGEVLGQRPMSQHLGALAMVSKESGCHGLVVRPLSAKLLPVTTAEEKGLVDRDKLLGIRGRSRKPQQYLAEKYSLGEYPSPAGGCRLTEPNFVRRLEDLRDHEGLKDIPTLRLLRLGRHFRLPGGMKLVVGRNEADNNAIEASAGPNDAVLKIEQVPGPTGLLPRTDDQAALSLAGSICARYSDAQRGIPVGVSITSAAGQMRLDAVPADEAEVNKLMVS